MKVAELLFDESKWIQGKFAKDVNDQEVDIQSSRACKFCLLGAIRYCYPVTYEDVNNRLYSVLKSINVQSIAIFNDSHNYEEVMELVRRADI